MSKLYDLNIVDEDTDGLLDIDGELDAIKFVRAIPEEVVEAIDDIVDIYDRNAWGIFDGIFCHQKPSLAWAYILLDREYAVANVVRKTLNDDSGIKFAHYSVLYSPQFPNEQNSIGYLWIKDKASLADVADTSVLWAECWRVLADASATKRWIAFLDPLPKDWSYRNENSNVFDMWHEVKAHAASGMKSHDKH